MAFFIDYYSNALQEQILALSPSMLADFLRLTDLLQEFGPALRMPHSRAMGDGVFELRIKGKEGIGRVFYCFVSGQRIWLLHCCIKKTQKTPQRELQIARERMKEVKNAQS
ncbi:MAG: type II toxin-antitoxin system RelE/ParE family toxin [Candidatus Sericytochromatia bacterium]